MCEVILLMTLSLDNLDQNRSRDNKSLNQDMYQDLIHRPAKRDSYHSNNPIVRSRAKTKTQDRSSVLMNSSSKANSSNETRPEKSKGAMKS